MLVHKGLIVLAYVGKMCKYDLGDYLQLYKIIQACVCHNRPKLRTEGSEVAAPTPTAGVAAPDPITT